MRTTLREMELAPTPPAPADRRTLYEEMLVVLALSLLASVAYAIVSLLTQPLRGTTVAAASQNPLFAYQVLGFVFGFAPVFLVIHLVERDGEGPDQSVQFVLLNVDRIRNEDPIDGLEHDRFMSAPRERGQRVGQRSHASPERVARSVVVIVMARDAPLHGPP